MANLLADFVGMKRKQKFSELKFTNILDNIQKCYEIKKADAAPTNFNTLSDEYLDEEEGYSLNGDVDTEKNLSNLSVEEDSDILSMIYKESMFRT